MTATRWDFIFNEIEANINELTTNEEKLIKLIKELYTNDKRGRVTIIESIKRAFETVIEPFEKGLLSTIWHNWGGIVLWNFIDAELLIFGNTKSKKLNLKRFNLINKFLEWNGFDFKEPMSTIIFRRDAKTLPIIFSSNSLTQDYSKDVIILNFQNLFKYLDSSSTLNNDLIELYNFVEIESHFDKHSNVFFKELRDRIVRISTQILLDKNIYEELAFNLNLLEKFEIANLNDLYTIDDLCKVIIWNKLYDDSWRFLYFIPVRQFKKFGVGGFVLATEFEINYLEYSFIQSIVNRVVGFLGTNLSLVHHEKTILIQAIKSAVAAIMARNLSHNIGSHILTYLKDRIRDVPTAWKNHLLEIQKISDGEVLNSTASNFEYRLKITKEHFQKIHIDCESSLNDIEAPFLLGLSRFIGYLQERQDFIATISTDYIPYNSTINFKEFVYDELNWDYKIQRHHNLLPHNAENILLDNIARSEKLDRHRIHIWFNNFNGFEDKIILNGIAQEHPDLKELRAVNIDLPGSVIGRQSMFSIIENIIRNSAKHGLKHGQEKTSFVITAESVNILREKHFPQELIAKITFIDGKNKKYGMLNVPFISKKTFKEGIIKSLGKEVFNQYGQLLLECA